MATGFLLLSFLLLGDIIDREFSLKNPCLEDQIAISRLKQGDLNSLEALVNRYQVQAVQAAYMIVYDRALAEDVAQAAFVKVAERVNQYDEDRPFRPWFFRIIVNDALKAAKKQKRNFSLEEQLDESMAQLAEWLKDPSLQPEQLVEQKETQTHILKTIQSLPPDQRAVIVMRYFLEMSEADMSEKIDRPLSTIKWWLRDARKRLRNLIGSSHGLEDRK
jgi:RNA polymerase sigma-70 factor (ECF subfamily)